MAGQNLLFCGSWAVGWDEAGLLGPPEELTSRGSGGGVSRYTAPGPNRKWFPTGGDGTGRRVTRENACGISPEVYLFKRDGVGAGAWVASKPHTHTHSF